MTQDVTAPLSRFLRLLVSIIGIGIASGVLIGVPACGDDAAAPMDDGGGAFNGTIRVLDNSFSPKNVTISAADSVTITWRWEGSNLHTVTHGTSPTDLGGLFDHGPKSSGTFAYRFTDPGTVPYFCRPHFPGMAGTITVEP